MAGRAGQDRAPSRAAARRTCPPARPSARVVDRDEARFGVDEALSAIAAQSTRPRAPAAHRSTLRRRRPATRRRREHDDRGAGRRSVPLPGSCVSCCTSAVLQHTSPTARAPTTQRHTGSGSGRERRETTKPVIPTASRPSAGREDREVALDDVTDYEDGQGEQAVLADGERPRDEDEQRERQQRRRRVPDVAVGLGRERGEHQRDRDGGGDDERTPPWRRARSRTPSTDATLTTPAVAGSTLGSKKRAGIASSQ